MEFSLDIDPILAPIAGDNPAGENLRYTQVYEDIKEARRADDPYDRGDWQHELKTSDWHKVIKLSVEALTEKSKDLQIAAWLTEALTNTEGLAGLRNGFAIIKGFLLTHWDHLHPEIEEDDLEFRAGPLEGLNDRLPFIIKEIPLTDPGRTPGYSWYNWQESRQVGHEADTLDQYGEIDKGKKDQRDALIADGKITAETFDESVEISQGSFHISLSQNLDKCIEAFEELDKIIDEKFGRDAPRLAEIRSALQDCGQVVARILKDKNLNMPVADSGQGEAVGGDPQEEKPPVDDVQSSALPAESATDQMGTAMTQTQLTDTGSLEKDRWQEALNLLNSTGMEQALRMLYSASCSSASVRDHNRYQLLMAKLCLKAQRPDLARPIVERLNTLIEELQLERWESPIWIAEVTDTLYQCLIQGNATDEEIFRAQELLKKLCITDVTKAMSYKS